MNKLFKLGLLCRLMIVGEQQYFIVNTPSIHEM